MRREVNLRVAGLAGNAYNKRSGQQEMQRVEFYESDAFDEEQGGVIGHRPDPMWERHGRMRTLY